MTSDYVGPARSLAEQKRETWERIKATQPELAQLMLGLVRIDPKAIRAATIGGTSGDYIELTPERMAAWKSLHEPAKRSKR